VLHRTQDARVHVPNIPAKLGVSTRTEAAAIVHRVHILDGQ
jgi:DNA-binding NarL/FixJ family response regulator